MRHLFTAAFSCCFLSVLLAACGSGEQVYQPGAKPADPDKVLAVLKDSFSIDYLTGKFDPAEDSRFAVIPDSLADRPGLLLRTEALDALVRMAEQARRDGHQIRVLSATRNFEYQKGIWEKKWKGERILSNGKNAAVDYPDPVERARAILLYSSMPGTSRHHWGTDFDINALENEYFETGAGAALFTWMEIHAAKYGFCRPYTDKSGGRTGYEEEKWHWSFTPLSAPMTEAARAVLRNEDIAGFAGSEVSDSIDVRNQYILGIDPDCLVRK